MSSLHVFFLGMTMLMTMFVFERVRICGAERVCGVGRPYGQKIGDEGTVDRRTDEHHKKITRERQMYNKRKMTPSHPMRFVALIFLHLPW